MIYRKAGGDGVITMEELRLRTEIRRDSIFPSNDCLSSWGSVCGCVLCIVLMIILVVYIISYGPFSTENFTHPIFANNGFTIHPPYLLGTACLVLLL